MGAARTETWAHVNTAWLHPTLRDLGLLNIRRINLHLLALRYTLRTSGQQWIRSFLSFIEEKMWADDELAGDIWNGR